MPHDCQCLSCNRSKKERELARLIEMLEQARNYQDPTEAYLHIDEVIHYLQRSLTYL